MTSRGALASAGVLLALAMVCGSVGEHALKARLAAEPLRLWDMAVRYQFFNSLGLLGLGLTLRLFESASLHAAAALVAAGVVLFAGGVYALSLGAPHAFAVLPPLGGIALIAGWLIYAWGIWRASEATVHVG